MADKEPAIDFYSLGRQSVTGGAPAPETPAPRGQAWARNLDVLQQVRSYLPSAETVGTAARDVAAAMDPMGEVVTAGLSGEQPRTQGPAAALRTVPGLVTAPTLAVPGLGYAVPAAASALGEAGAQLVESDKITSPTQIGIAAAVPPALGAAGKAVSAGIKRLPGAPSMLQETAVAGARAIPERFGGAALAKRAETLYGQVEKLNPPISTANLRQAVTELAQTEARVPGSLQGPLKSVLDDLDAVMAKGGDVVPFQDVRAIMRRIGQRTGSITGAEANEVRSGFKFLDRAMQQDLEAAAAAGGGSGKAAGLLREANKTHARVKAIEDIGGAIETAINKGRSDLQQSFNPARALNELADSPSFARSFTPQEQAEIREVLTRFKGLPSLPPVGGQAAIGSGRTIGRYIVGSGLGGAAGGAMAPDESRGIGAGLGMAAGVVTANMVHAGIASAVTSKAGRAFLTRVLDQGGGILPASAMATLAQAGRAYLVGEPSGANE